MQEREQESERLIAKNDDPTGTAEPPKIHSVRFYIHPKLRATLIALLAMVFLSSAADLIFSNKTGIAYTPKGGKRQILSPQQVISLKDKDVVASDTKSFAVVINTYKRPDMLKLALNHWVNTCGTKSNISQVFVIWAELDVKPPEAEDILEEFTTKLRTSKKGKKVDAPSVEFLLVPKDSLNSRFLPIKNLKTEAVFMVDDDVRVDCASIKSGFEAWRHYPDALVGFYARLASPKLGLFKSKADMIYHTWPVVFAKQKFNIILTKACFLNSKYLKMYHDDEENPKEILEYVDKGKNCEDVAMAFMVARKTDQSSSKGYCRDCPVYTRGHISDEGLLNGISTSGGSLAPQGHMEKRSQCLDDITKIYEKRGWKYPLVDVKMSDQSWHHHLFWWQYLPSNVFEWFSFGNTHM